MDHHDRLAPARAIIGVHNALDVGPRPEPDRQPQHDPVGPAIHIALDRNPAGGRALHIAHALAGQGLPAAAQPRLPLGVIFQRAALRGRMLHHAHRADTPIIDRRVRIAHIHIQVAAVHSRVARSRLDRDRRCARMPGRKSNVAEGQARVVLHPHQRVEDRVGKAAYKASQYVAAYADAAVVQEMDDCAAVRRGVAIILQLEVRICDGHPPSSANNHRAAGARAVLVIEKWSGCAADRRYVIANARAGHNVARQHIAVAGTVQTDPTLHQAILNGRAIDAARHVAIMIGKHDPPRTRGRTRLHCNLANDQLGQQVASVGPRMDAVAPLSGTVRKVADRKARQHRKRIIDGRAIR